MDRLRQAMQAQLVQRAAVMRRGAERVGWKLGMGERERIDGSIAVGYLTSATTFAEGAEFDARDAVDLRADVELAVKVGTPVRYAAALEIVDLELLEGEPDSVIATNIFHRAVAFGAWSESLPPSLEGALLVNGDLRASARADVDVGERLRSASRVLAAVDEELRADDVVITGSIVQVRVAVGDDVTADLGPLGSVTLSIRA